MTARAYERPPNALVQGGNVKFGTFDGPIASVNLIDAAIGGRVKWPRAMRRMRLKEWQAVQVGNKRWFMIVALFNAQSVGLVQVKLYDRVAKKKYLYERKVAPWKLTIPDNLVRSRAEYESNDCTVRFINRLADNRLSFEIDIKATKDTPSIRGSVLAFANGVTPQVVSLPFDGNRGMYSHKSPLPVEGEMSIDGENVPLTRGEAYLLVDDHKGYYPYVMEWDWVTGAQWRDGKLFAFNLTRNQCNNPTLNNENCVWIDGEPHLLPAVKFERNGEGVGATWRVRDELGRVDATFTIELDGRVDLNALIVESRYRGPFGYFSGYVQTGGGDRVSLDGMFGMGEKFYLRT